VGKKSVFPFRPACREKLPKLFSRRALVSGEIVRVNLYHISAPAAKNSRAGLACYIVLFWAAKYQRGSTAESQR
jgi:hypothetical protein